MQISNQPFGRTSATSSQLNHTPLFLRQGQIFQGQVTKLFPNQLAALHIGNQAVTARLEAALMAGKKYYFEVLSTEGVPRLKVLTSTKERGGHPQSKPASSPQQLLQSLGLSEHKSEQFLLRHFQQSGVPFTKEMLHDGAHVLRQNGMVNDHGVNVISKMVEGDLPVTTSVFQAILATDRKDSLSSQLSSFQQQMEDMLGSLQTDDSKRNVQAILRTLHQVNDHMNVFQSASQRQDTFLQHMFSLAADGDELMREGVKDWLIRLNVLPKGSTNEEWIQQFKQSVVTRTHHQSIQQLWPFLRSVKGVAGSLESMSNDEVFRFLIRRLPAMTGSEGARQGQALLSLFHESSNTQDQQPISTEEIPTYMKQLVNQGVVTENERRVFSRMMTPSVAGEQMVKLLQALGMDVEGQIAQYFNRGRGGDEFDQSDVQERLKPILQQHIPHLPPSLKEGAEQLLQRMTGHQLLSFEHNGLFQHIVLQFPLILKGFKTDLTVQWENKKATKNGCLDPNHCRIVFYLQLKHLKETMVDVHIQDRHISIQILNENQRPDSLIQALQPFLKEQLQRLDYSLSSLTWKTMNEQKSKSLHHTYRSNIGYEGVDVRI